MLRIKRLRTVDDPAFESAMALYAASFPPHEQRLEPSQRRIMAHEQYHFGILHDEEGFAGLALFWDAGAYLYVEHLCISPARRGQGLGTAALDLFAEAGKPVVLEIDPPVDAVSRRRQKFYERAGFAANPLPRTSTRPTAPKTPATPSWSCPALARLQRTNTPPSPRILPVL